MSRQLDPAAAKAEAIRQWTADPCGSDTTEQPGTAAYAEQLLSGRRDYAPWFAEALDYRGAKGLGVLDVGCGQGIDVIEYARAGANVVGIDLTPRHVELAREHASALEIDAQILQGDAEQLPFQDETFDRVSSNGVLHHTPDIGAALREIHRVLKPGGEARILIYNRYSFHYWLHQVLWEGIWLRRLLREGSMKGVLSSGVERSSIGARPLVRVTTPAEVRRLMRGAGFVDGSTRLGGFNASDTPITDILARRTRLLDNPATLEWLGRVGGWYVLGYGRRP